MAPPNVRGLVVVEDTDPNKPPEEEEDGAVVAPPKLKPVPAELEAVPNLKPESAI